MQNADEVYTLAVEIIAENAIKSSKEVEKCLKSVDKDEVSFSSNAEESRYSTAMLQIFSRNSFRLWP